MISKTILPFAILLLLFSCGNKAPLGGIELNNGKKWEVNAEMMPHIQASNLLVSEYLQSGNSDYKALAKQLVDNNNRLISSCNMKGKSHEELHKWLHPYMQQIEALKQASDISAAETVVFNIQESFKTFDQFFE